MRREAACGTITVAILAGVILAACSTSNDEPRVVVSGTADSVVVTTARPAWLGPVDLPIEVVYRSRPEVDLTDVRDGVLLSDGGAAIVDRRLRAVVRFDDRGRVAWIQGREGAGPGEFLAPYTMGRLPGDTVVVYDQRASRLTLLADSGSPVVRTVAPIVDGAIDVWRLPDGRLAAYEGSRRDAEVITSASDADLLGARALVRIVDMETGSSDTVFVGGVASEMVRIGPMYLMAAFGRSTRVGVRGAELVIAPSDGFRVIHVDDSGVRTVSEMPGAARPLDMGEVTRLRDSLRAESAAAGAPSVGDAIFDPDLQPDTRPAFSAVRLGSSGRILLREFAPGLGQSDVWWLVSTQGAFMGRVRLPPRTDVLDIGDDLMLVARLDDFDVPTIEMLRVAWDRLPGAEDPGP